jgi:hypothetical protein
MGAVKVWELLHMRSFSPFSPTQKEEKSPKDVLLVFPFRAGACNSLVCNQVSLAQLFSDSIRHSTSLRDLGFFVILVATIPSLIIRYTYPCFK